DGFAVFRVGEKLADSVINAASGGFRPPANTALIFRLSGHAGGRVDLTVVERLIRIQDPGHFARTGAVIGRRHVQARADEVFPDQLGRIATGNLFELLLIVFARADFHTSLGAAKR